MLKIGPWYRLPLTVHWLDYEFFKKYYGCISPPLHMPVCHNDIITCKAKKTQRSKTNVLLHELDLSMENTLIFCFLCGSYIMEKNSITCIQPKCSLIAHLICLAKTFCKDGMILPIEGTCPACSTNVLWGDLIKKRNGCYQYLQEANVNCSSSDSNI